MATDFKLKVGLDVPASSDYIKQTDLPKLERELNQGIQPPIHLKMGFNTDKTKLQAAVNVLAKSLPVVPVKVELDVAGLKSQIATITKLLQNTDLSSLGMKQREYKIDAKLTSSEKIATAQAEVERLRMSFERLGNMSDETRQLLTELADSADAAAKAGDFKEAINGIRLLKAEVESLLKTTKHNADFSDISDEYKKLNALVENMNTGVPEQVRQTVSEISDQLNKISNKKDMDLLSEEELNQLIRARTLIYDLKQAIGAVDKDDLKLPDLQKLQLQISSIDASLHKLGANDSGVANSVSKLKEELKTIQTAMDRGLFNPSEVAIAKELKKHIEQIVKEWKELKLQSGNNFFDASMLRRFTEAQNKLKSFVHEYKKVLTDPALKMEYDRLTNIQIDDIQNKGALESYLRQMNNFTTAADLAGKKVHTLDQRLRTMLENFSVISVITGSMYMLEQAFESAVQNVRNLDKAMTELRKVSDLSASEYVGAMETAKRSAMELGTTVSDMLNSTSDFMRLGHSLADSEMLARSANVYFSVADGIENIDDATSVLISTMQAFNMEAEESMFLADKLNELGNTTPASARDLGEALKRSSAAMAAANTDLDKTLGLIVAAQATVQNAEVVGTALKTLSMRVRGAKVELEEAGLETDNMATSTAKLREEVLALTHGKVDIMIDDETFKDIFVILQEISHEWDNINDVPQAALLNLLGGQRQANVLAAIIENFELAEEAAQTSMGAAGSAMKENEKQIQSLEGRITLFKAAWESLSETLLDSEGLKSIVDMGTGAIETLDKLVQSIGGVGTAIAALSGVGAYIALDSLPADVKTGEGLKDLFSNIGMELDFTGRKKTAKVQSDMMNTLADDADALQDFWDAFAGSDKNLNRANDAMKKMSESARSLAESLKEPGKAYASGCNDITEYVEIQGKSIESIKASTVASKAASIGMNLLASAAISAGVAFASMIITELVTYLHDVVFTTTAAREKIEEYSSELESLQSNEENIQKLGTRFEELSKKTSLTTDEQKEYNKIQNELHEMLPELEGFYDAQGNFIITEISGVEDLTRKYQELTGAKREALATEYYDGYFNDWKPSVFEEDVDALQRADLGLKSSMLQEYKDLYEKYKDDNSKGIAKWFKQMTDKEYNRYTLLQSGAYYAGKTPEAVETERQTTYNQAQNDIRGGLINRILGSKEYRYMLQDEQNALIESLQGATSKQLIEWSRKALTGGTKETLNTITSELLVYDDILSGRLDELSQPARAAVIDLGGLDQANTLLKEYEDNQQAINDGTYQWTGKLQESHLAAIEAYRAWLETQKASNETIDNTKPLSLEESQKGLIEDMNTLEESVKALGEAYSEFAEGGEITASTLASLSETFGSCGDEWTDFVSLVGSGTMTTKQLEEALNNLLTRFVEQKALTGDVTAETEQMLTTMLEAIGITNAEEVASHALSEALAEQEAQRIATANPALLNLSTQEIETLLREVNASQETCKALYKLYLAKIQASNGGLLAATQQEIVALQQLAIQAGATAESVAWMQTFARNNAIIQQYQANVMAGVASIQEIEAYEAAIAGNEALQESFNNLEFPVEEIEADYDRLVSSTASATSAMKSEFDKFYDELQYLREANLISEEEYLARLYEANERFNKNNLELYRKYQLEIFKTLKSLLADKINKQADAQIAALRKKREETEKYYNKLIEAKKKEREQQEKYYNDLIEAEKEKLKQLKEEWTVQDHLLKIEQARAALKAAQQQKTVHLYKEGEGFVWEADQGQVQDAQDGLNEAIKDYNRYLEEKEIQDRIDRLEKAKEEVLEMIDEQIEALEEAKERALEIIDEQIEAVEEWRDAALEALEELEMGMEEFLEFLEEWGIEIDEQLQALLAVLENFVANWNATVAQMQMPGFGGGGDGGGGGGGSGKNTGGSAAVKDGDMGIVWDEKGQSHRWEATVESGGNRYVDVIAPDGSIISKRFAEGTLSVPTTGMALTDEEGPEIRIPGKGTFRKLHYGDAILPADVSRNLWMIGAKPVSFAKGIANMISNKTDDKRQNVFHFGDIHLPNVQNAQNFADEFKDIVMKATQLAYSK